MDPIMEIAEKFNLLVIEDAAQAHGARYKGGKAGNLADMACFSFYGSKNMVTGEGGMVTSNNKEYAEKISVIRSIRGEEGSRSTALYHNYRMPELDAAIGFVQLRKLAQFLRARENNARILMEGLKDVEGIQLPKVPTVSRSAWHVFTIRLKKATDEVTRNNVVRRLREKQVEANVYYPKPVHLLPYYRKTYGSSKLPQTEMAAKQVLSLPINPSLTPKQLNKILMAVKTSINSFELD
jgi:dTDP-4-amino-4,6-dideoxygalactose transaminase